jgi:bisphosphoglycerate-independent phosphoglycerate mutase (AlkP superfamily)
LFSTRPVIILVISGWGVTAPGPANSFGYANVPNIQFLSDNYPLFELVLPSHKREVNLKIMSSSADLIDFHSRLLNVVNNNSLKHNPVLNSLIADITGTTSKLHVLFRADYFGSLNYKVALSILEYLKNTNLNSGQIKFYFLIEDNSERELLVKYIQTITEKVKSFKLGNIAAIAEINLETMNSSVLDIEELLVNARGKVVPNTVEILDKIVKHKKIGLNIISRADNVFQTVANMDAVIDLNMEGDAFAHNLRNRISNSFNREKSKTHGIDYANLSDLPDIHENVLIKPFEPITTLSRFFSHKQIYQVIINPREEHEMIKLALNSNKEILAGQDFINIYEPNILKEQRLIFQKLKEKLNENKYGMIYAYTSSLFNAAMTGKMDETILVLEELDKEISEIANFALHNNYVFAVTSDKGLAEAIYNSSGDIGKDNQNPVPAIFIDSRLKKISKTTANIKDFVPTLLHLCGYNKPGQMEGINLIS